MFDKMKMEAKRAEVMAEAAGLRKYPGTGYHDNDPLGPVKHPDPAGRRDAKLEDHVVCFRTTYEMVMVDPDGARCAAVMKAYYDANKDLISESRLDHEVRLSIETSKEYAERPLVDGCFIVRGGQWNDVLAIINGQNIGVTVTAVK